MVVADEIRCIGIFGDEVPAACVDECGVFNFGVIVPDLVIELDSVEKLVGAFCDEPVAAVSWVRPIVDGFVSEADQEVSDIFPFVHGENPGRLIRETMNLRLSYPDALESWTITPAHRRSNFRVDGLEGRLFVSALGVSVDSFSGSHSRAGLLIGTCRDLETACRGVPRRRQGFLSEYLIRGDTYSYIHGEQVRSAGSRARVVPGAAMSFRIPRETGVLFAWKGKRWPNRTINYLPCILVIFTVIGVTQSISCFLSNSFTFPNRSYTIVYHSILWYTMV